MSSRGKKVAKAKAVGKANREVKANQAPQNAKKALTDSGMTLRMLFNNESPADIAESFSAAPAKLTEDEVESLLAICKKIGMDVDRARSLALDLKPKKNHCVRCHKGYLEKNNRDGACVVKHDDDMELDPEFVGGEDEYRTECGGCGEVAFGDEPDFPDICFKGFHTTIEAEARGYLTCEDRECFD